MAQKRVSCFFTWCFDRLEKDCVDKGLLVLGKWAHRHLQSVKKGDIGFLLNVDHDELLGIFEAEGPGQLNADTHFWSGKYPAQVKVHQVGELKRITSAASKLEDVLRIRKVGKGWRVPGRVRYRPEVTEKVLALFMKIEKTPDSSHDSNKKPGIHSPSGSKRTKIHLVDLIDELIKHVRETNRLYKRNFDERVNRTYPIPFFGDLESAEVVTVGVNPSSSEFAEHRDWEMGLTSHRLLSRLKTYFNLSGVDAHEWFFPWKECLELLKRSYEDGNAAHMDLSPRATIPMSYARDKERFEQMVRTDLSWFSRFLPFLRSAKLMLMAGTVITAHGGSIDIDSLLVEDAPFHDFQLVDRHEVTPKPGRVALYKLVTPHFRLPTLFCSVSPSAKQNRDLLVKRIRENRELLMRCLSVDR